MQNIVFFAFFCEFSCIYKNYLLFVCAYTRVCIGWVSSHCGTNHATIYYLLYIVRHIQSKIVPPRRLRRRYARVPAMSANCNFARACAISRACVRICCVLVTRNYLHVRFIFRASFSKNMKHK